MTDRKIVKSTDPKVIEFLKYLGVDVGRTKKVVITVSMEEPVMLEVTEFAVKEVKEI